MLPAIIVCVVILIVLIIHFIVTFHNKNLGGSITVRLLKIYNEYKLIFNKSQTPAGNYYMISNYKPIAAFKIRLLTLTSFAVWFKGSVGFGINGVMHFILSDPSVR